MSDLDKKFKNMKVSTKSSTKKIKIPELPKKISPGKTYLSSISPVSVHFTTSDKKTDNRNWFERFFN